MTKERWQFLSETPDAQLTPVEILEGWHWCVEWDLLLVGPGMGELRPCSCWPKDHPVYLTMPPELPPLIDGTELD